MASGLGVHTASSSQPVTPRRLGVGGTVPAGAACCLPGGTQVASWAVTPSRAVACSCSPCEEKGSPPSCCPVSCLKHRVACLRCSPLMLFSCACLQIFEQFVKTRIKEEYKEKKSKLLLAKEEFRKLLEESKVSPRYGEKYARKEGRGG